MILSRIECKHNTKSTTLYVTMSSLAFVTELTLSDPDHAKQVMNYTNTLLSAEMTL